MKLACFPLPHVANVGLGAQMGFGLSVFFYWVGL